MFIPKLLAVGLVFALPTSLVQAGSNITNTIHVESNTGGNIVTGGRVIEGKREASVDITTVINGETLVDIHETSTGTPITIRKEVTASTTHSVVTTDIQLNAAPAAPETEKRIATTTPAVAVNPVPDTTTVASSTSITNVTNEYEGSYPHEEGASVEDSLFARIFHSITRTVTYVLSKLFT